MTRSTGQAALMVALLAAACGEPTEETLFTRLEASESGIGFVNELAFQDDFNIIEYLYFYDGGGVAIGDVNRDGLQDIFLTGNQVSNRLYLNRADLRFEDATEAAGLASTGWSTGATMADVDGDGWLDLYVCQVSYKNQSGRNLLYLNQQDGTFEEAASRLGLDFEGLSTQAAFLDYDRDGDLDLYLLNHSVHTRGSFVPAWRRTVDAPRVGDRLYRNEGGESFTNVTSQARIHSSALGYGLGLAVSDIDDDGWPDIYVGNDFHEDDYLYLNQQDGTFEEVLRHVAGHTSQSTMGVDIADINGDLWPDIIALDMMPADWATYQASGGPDEEGIAAIKRRLGYGSQVTRNTVQMHRGLGADGYPRFSEVGAYLGLHATDWSWAPLLADLDGDGWKDLFVTNGIPRRPNDLDYVAFVGLPSTQRILKEGSAADIQRVTRRMPKGHASNYAFKSLGGLSYIDVSSAWGLHMVGSSQGAAWGDLDNDGDLDLVVSHINAHASVYRNNTVDAHHLSVSLQGNAPNTSGIGSRVVVYAGGRAQMQEQFPTRGFQSSVAHILTFGLGTAAVADSVVVRWPSGGTQTLRSIRANQRLVLDEGVTSPAALAVRLPASEPLLIEVPDRIPWRHAENSFEDLVREPLLLYRISTQGPALAVADADGDGLDDIFLGGARGQAGVLFFGGTTRSLQPALDGDALHEDVGATFLDADLDGDADLYVVSGGGEPDSALWADRLYFNDGAGTFTKSAGRLPALHANGCCVQAADFDLDGDADLFVAARSLPGHYGVRPSSALLVNDGTGLFRDATAEFAAPLLNLGMVTAAAWANVTGDAAPDLVVVGEWMPITILANRDSYLYDVTNELGLADTDGWWQSVLAGDFDGDGDTDLAAGNLGLNHVLPTPMHLYVHDFDQDGRSDPIITWGDPSRLWARRDILSRQMPALASVAPSYSAYAGMNASALVNTSSKEPLTAHTSASAWLENTGTFAVHALPDAAQWAPIMGMVHHDIDGNGLRDVVAVGNLYGAGAALGPLDASFGTVLLQTSPGTFIAADAQPWTMRGDARGVRLFSSGVSEMALVVAHSDGQPQVFRLRAR